MSFSYRYYFNWNIVSTILLLTLQPAQHLVNMGWTLRPLKCFSKLNNNELYTQNIVKLINQKLKLYYLII